MPLPGKDNESWKRWGGGCGWQAGISGLYQVKGHLKARPLLDTLGSLFNSDMLSNLQEFPLGLSYEIAGFGCCCYLLGWLVISSMICMKQST